MKPYQKILTSTALVLALTSPVFTASAVAGDDPEVLITDGEFFGEVRYRYETVEQDGFANDADAHTVRTNFGFKTGIYKGFQALAEAQIVQSLGDDDFNSTTNGNTAFPIVADPDGAELNEFWLSWSGLPETTIKAGRQKINIDNQRFVGTVGWRQNDQTFDAVQVTNSSVENLDLFYSYVGNVNRIQGGDHPLGDLDSSVHLVNASYTFSDWLKLSGYGYWLDFDEVAANSSKTYGVRATGSVPINDAWAFTYEAEAATQDNYANNTTNYDETYFHIVPGLVGHGFTFKAGYELLGGNGTASFRTPLATGHKFNGWADVFLTTPTAGLEDMYLGASYKVSETNGLFDGTKFSATYHDFDSDSATVGDFGNELDLSIGKSFALPDAGQPFESVNVLLKYADYEGESAAGVDADRQKIWLQVGFKF